MTGRLRTSRAGLELIKSFEGFREAAARLPDGRWTIGYGHVRSAREGIVISEKDAEDLLRYDLMLVEEAILSLAYAPLNQTQFDALASLVFNISPGQFKDSDILRRINAGEYMAAANGFDAWRKARVNGRLIVVDALVRRRAMEKAMFLEPPGGRPPAPTPLVTPEYDPSALTGAVEVVASLKSPSATVMPKTPPAATPAPPPARPANDDVSETAITQAIGNLVAKPAIEPVESRTQAPPQSKPEPVAAKAGPQVSEAPSATPDDASKVVAARIARILARADKAAETHAIDPAAKLHPAFIRANGDILEGLPDFEAPPVKSPAARPNGAARPRIFIDDTEVFDPGRDPAELFAEGEESERKTSTFRQLGLPLPATLAPKLMRLAPWIAIGILALLGVAIGLVEGFSDETPGRGLGASTTVLAVSGLMLIMSIYFIATRAADPDR